MKRKAIGSFTVLIALVVSGKAAGNVPGITIFADNFEFGLPDTQIPMDLLGWQVGGVGAPAFYRNTNNPFSSGNTYAELKDTELNRATRLLSTFFADPLAYGPQITGNVTTFSFDFWEALPDVETPGQPGLGVGYYGNGQIDLNTAGRNFRALLHNGVLSPDQLVAGTGGPVSYPRETVHRLYMIANDSPDAVANYNGGGGGQTLEPAQADVWIAMGGATPVYAFSVHKQNPLLGPYGIGFRTFFADIEEFRIDNVLLESGISIDVTSAVPEPTSLASVLCGLTMGLTCRGWRRRAWQSG
jgi:hypothetical protein